MHRSHLVCKSHEEPAKYFLVDAWVLFVRVDLPKKIWHHLLSFLGKHQHGSLYSGVIHRKSFWVTDAIVSACKATKIKLM